jgi:hypothetical protein
MIDSDSCRECREDIFAEDLSTNLVMAACGLHVVLLIIKHAAFLFLLFNIQIGLLMYVDASS